MLTYILKRAGFNLGVMVVVVTLTFFLMRLLPGDPFMSQRLNPEIKENLYAKYGLDQPVSKQYLDYLAALARFDLVESLKYPGRTVNGSSPNHFPFLPQWAFWPWSWRWSWEWPWGSWPAYGKAGGRTG
jgi:oligopeptide transport system permease protein